MSPLEAEIRTRLTQLFTDIAHGEVPAPGARLRIEGLLEAAVLAGIATPERLTGIMGNLYTEVFGETLDVKLGDDWQKWQPFPQIPAFSARAPVSPSTSD
jgi:hypothetical protein